MASVSASEVRAEKLPFPKAIYFIIGNEFCERFCYYGMRAILVIYLTRKLSYTGDESTIVYHVFSALVYFWCVLGAIISDSWWGKFKTIIYLSLVYISGSTALALGAIPQLHLPAATFTMIGLGLIALGSGGIKPCVAAFGGDQFKLPEQSKYLTTYFLMFYFSINAGSLISTVLTPILRENVYCFGEKECYSLAFGVPAVLMATATIIIYSGYPLYKIVQPKGNMLVLVSKTIGNALATKWKESKTNPRENWLDYADKKFDKELIESTKVLMRVVFLYIPMPVFWALFDQQGSRWVLLASRMDGDVGFFNIKPDQVLTLNPLMILAFIPLFDQFLYPALALVGIHTPLRKMAMGGVLTGVSFLLAGFVALAVEATDPILPKPLSTQLRIFNGENCAYSIDTNIVGHPKINIPAYGYYENTNIPVTNGKFAIEYSFTSTTAGCSSFASGSYELEDNQAYSLFMSSKNTDHPLIWYTDTVEKPIRAFPVARTLCNVQPGLNIEWKDTKKGTVAHSEPAYLKNLTEFIPGEYTILVGNYETTPIELRIGGVYAVMISEESSTLYTTRVTEVTPPNSLNMLWLVPQYTVITLGEVMLSVTALEFSYAQAPVTMKAVLTACWLLTTAIGNVIVILIAKLSIGHQSYEFFLFGLLMIADMCLFIYLAVLYKPNIIV